ncbi:GrpB family protein [Chlorogloeopsis sp. ULAP01]|uniref:GrpB family protein n=1 Tax=Chlorogloeopsis sp. ULAP01 TaxID=3056483 RepID=UPI0025AAC7B5|nr:GrpB family protein [Chlorogloeopsis sp. ULAP01]MDM9379545.1 GrpB family protein [Chlorogloeopsis sp. ULAP01]
MSDEIDIVEYEPRWQAMFAQEAARLQQALGDDLVVEIEHIGSTAVPGLAAKPIIDIMIGVQTLADAKAVIPLMEALGYVYWRDNPCLARMFFVKGMPPYGKQRTHHVHIVEAYGEFWQRKLFRDYLRIHSDEAKRYEALKRDLAACFRTDREAYTEAKSEYIKAVMEKARRFFY